MHLRKPKMPHKIVHYLHNQYGICLSYSYHSRKHDHMNQKVCIQAFVTRYRINKSMYTSLCYPVQDKQKYVYKPLLPGT